MTVRNLKLSKLAAHLALVAAAAAATTAALAAVDPGAIRNFTPGQKFDAADIIRGGLPASLFGPVKVGKCPAGAQAAFGTSNATLSCTKDVLQLANVSCGNPRFPRYVAMASGAGSERDVCASQETGDGRAIRSETNLNDSRAKGTCDSGDTLLQHSSGLICLNPGVSISANSNLGNFAEGRNRDFYRATVTQERVFEVNVDFERVPVNGNRNGFSYVQNVAIGDVVNQGWTLDVTQPGATDKFKRVIKRKVSAILVDQQ